MAPWLRELADLPEDLSLDPGPTWGGSQSPVTPALRDPPPSLGLCGNLCVCISVCVRIQFFFFKKRLLEKLVVKQHCRRCSNGCWELKMNKTQEMLTYPKDNSLFGLKNVEKGKHFHNRHQNKCKIKK